MSADEIFALVLSIACAGVGLRAWYAPLFGVTRLGGAPAGRRLPLLLLPPACLAIVLPVLTRFAAHEVVERPTYAFLFAVAGVAWGGLTLWLLPLAGVSYRDDAVERHNPAAVAATCGAVLGTTLCYTGSNIGEGATIWTTFFPAAVSTALLMLLWIVLALGSGASDAITVDRDLASGLRVAGFLFGTGLVLGRAAAGDWQSIEATLRDFAQLGWPAALLAAVSLMLQRLVGPTPTRPRPSALHAGLVPAIVIVSISLSFVAWSAKPLRSTPAASGEGRLPATAPPASGPATGRSWCAYAFVSVWPDEAKRLKASAGRVETIRGRLLDVWEVTGVTGPMITARVVPSVTDGELVVVEFRDYPLSAVDWLKGSGGDWLDRPVEVRGTIEYWRWQGGITLNDAGPLQPGDPAVAGPRDSKGMRIRWSPPR